MNKYPSWAFVQKRAKEIWKIMSPSKQQTTNAGTPFFADGFGVMIIGKKQRPASPVIGNTAPRQKEEDRMEKWNILKSPRPKKPAIHGGLRKEEVL